jgi:hypothetical protein
MAPVLGDRCAEIARALDEPMVGTAPSTRRWLCLERTEAWPSDITRVNEPEVRALLTRASAAGFRPLLIRSTQRGPAGRPPRIFLTDTAPGRSLTTVLDVERPEQWGDVPLPGPDQALPGDPVTGPLFLICTHGERDPCCGLRGRALAVAVAGPDVFASSHLGGHRYAPTALVLPTGYTYGRLDPAAAAAIRDDAAAGLMTVDGCRGRCTWSPRGQVAELAVREATGLRSPDALTVDDDSDDTVHVASATGERWAVDVESVEVDATRPASCGARPTLMVPLRAASVRALRTSM